MIFLYQAGIFFYSFSIRIASTFNAKARLFIKGRKNWEKILREKVDKKSKYIWFHCASLGEFEQGRPVIEKIKKQFPEYKIALTFFSPSGYEIKKNSTLVDIVAYLPLDTRHNARKFLAILNPEKAFFVKYEFWLINSASSSSSGFQVLPAIIKLESPLNFSTIGIFFELSAMLATLSNRVSPEMEKFCTPIEFNSCADVSFCTNK